MTGKRSRYYRLEDVTFPDRKGIERECKALRRNPDAAGRFLHTVEASDRLDHLAYKYYRQSLHWWRICDANPQFADPLALLGKTPAAEIRLELNWSGSTPPLTDFYDALAGIVGVLRVLKGGDNGLPVIGITDGPPLFTLAGALQTQLDAAVLGQSLPGSLDTALQAQGLTLSGALRFKRLEDDLSQPGKKVWQAEKNDGATLYRFIYSPDTGLISVSQASLNYTIEVFVTYNRNSVTQSVITSAIEALGFTVAEAASITRIGQGLVIPPRYTGRD